MESTGAEILPLSWAGIWVNRGSPHCSIPCTRGLNVNRYGVLSVKRRYLVPSCGRWWWPELYS